MHRSLTLLLAVAAVSCGSPGSSDPDANGHDTTDAGPADPSDANDVDAGELDAGELDAGELDAGELDAGPIDPPEPWGGDCDAAFPGQPGDWDHSFSSPATTLNGAANHRIRDVVLNPGESSQLRARFTYGPIDKDLEDETVEIWLQRCPAWERLGRLRTNHDGIVHVNVPTDLPKGEYRVRAWVPGDESGAEGLVAIWPSGTHAIVTDIDGTLTTSDAQALNDIFLGNDAEMYDDADTAIRRWSAKHYRVLYLTGRPQIWNAYSRRWLSRHAFPRGPVMLTVETGDVLPTDSGVRTFKGETVNGIKARGVSFRVAYGNATTDIGAYEDAALPKSDTFIIGDHAGEDGTVGLSSYTAHLPTIETYLDAVQP